MWRKTQEVKKRKERKKEKTIKRGAKYRGSW